MHRAARLERPGKISRAIHDVSHAISNIAGCSSSETAVVLQVRAGRPPTDYGGSARSDIQRHSRFVARVVQLSAFKRHLPAQTSFPELRLIHRLAAESLGCGGRHHGRENQGKHDQVSPDNSNTITDAVSGAWILAAVAAAIPTSA